MRHLDGATVVTQCDRQRVVAHDAYRRELRCGGKRSVARRGQKQIAVPSVAPLQGHALAGSGQRPELTPLTQDTGCLQFEATDFGQVRSEEHTSELPSLMRISYVVFCLKKNKIYDT